MSRLGYQPGRWTGWGGFDREAPGTNPTNENMYSIYGNSYAANPTAPTGPAMGGTSAGSTTTAGTTGTNSRPPAFGVSGGYWR
jgi:hypothetical protein